MNSTPFIILSIGLLIASIFYRREIHEKALRIERQRLALKDARVAIETLQIINTLRDEEGHSVTIVSDNADFNGQPNCLITCMGDWTNWEDRRFSGDTVIECLRAAMAEYQEMQVPEGCGCDCCPKSATRVMNSKSSKWCAEWFCGCYCGECFDGVEAEMKRMQVGAGGPVTSPCTFKEGDADPCPTCPRKASMLYMCGILQDAAKP